MGVEESILIQIVIIVRKSLTLQPERIVVEKDEFYEVI